MKRASKFRSKGFIEGIHKMATSPNPEKCMVTVMDVVFG